MTQRPIVRFADAPARVRTAAVRARRTVPSAPQGRRRRGGGGSALKRSRSELLGLLGAVAFVALGSGPVGAVIGQGSQLEYALMGLIAPLALFAAFAAYMAQLNARDGERRSVAL